MALLSPGDVVTLGGLWYGSAQDAYDHTNALTSPAGTALTVTEDMIVPESEYDMTVPGTQSRVLRAQVNGQAAYFAASQLAGHVRDGITPHVAFSGWRCDCGGKWCDGFNGIPAPTRRTRLEKLAAFVEDVLSEAYKAYAGKDKGALKDWRVVWGSAIRCPKADKEAGGNGHAHPTGHAADVRFFPLGASTGISQSLIAAAAVEVSKKSAFKGSVGVGHGGNHFTHLDIGYRSGRLVWKY